VTLFKKNISTYLYFDNNIRCGFFN